MNQKSMIELSGVGKYFKQGFGKVYILKNINLSIKEGEFVSIMGHRVQENLPSCIF